MAAPIPPGGGARGLGGGLAPPPPPPGPVGPVGPAGPPGPLPARAALLAQLVAAMQAAAAGLPGPGPAPPPPRVKISPPIFKGLPGERPEAHLLRANDWMDTYNILPVNKPANFKHTHDNLAREWYNSLTFPIIWNDLQQRFSRYFSTQGRSIKHIFVKWRNFSFTPGQDDIEAYIRDVKEAAHQLNYNDEAVLHLIKATMPSEIYGTLYNQHDLNTVITMVKDIYAKKPEPANPPTTTGGVTAPFTLIKAPNGSSKRVHFQEGESLSERIDKLTETLYQMDMEGKPAKKPYKPYITSPRHRGGRGGFRPIGGRSSSDRGEGWPRSKGRFQGGRGGFSHRGRFQGRKFDKSLTTKRPRVSNKAEDKDKDQCYHCCQRGHLAADCPERNKTQPPKSSKGKKFEDYTYAHRGAEEPQLAMATAMPQDYEEALSAMWQESRSPAWFKHVRGDFCSIKMLPKDGVRPQLIPEHEIECLSSPQAELLYEYMKEGQAIDPVKLGLCEYQAIEPVNPYYVTREDNDSIMEVSPYEALVINDASKIGAIESLSDPKPEQDTMTTDRTPPANPTTTSEEGPNTYGSK